ncbi:MAG TPA: hypothetical protein DEP12_05220 [Planctomycetaceae bacterium]|nr:hypothetical protein [Planctomycetaceae bacterium]
MLFHWGFWIWNTAFDLSLRLFLLLGSGGLVPAGILRDATFVDVIGFAHQLSQGLKVFGGL